MRRSKALRLALAAGLLGAAAVFIPWPVPLPAEWNGLKIIHGEARWIPWSRLELSKLEIRAQSGGRLYLEKVEVRPQLAMLARGRQVTLWTFGKVRLDPDSWGIRQEPAREILSAEPAADGGSARMEAQPDRWVLEQLELRGRLLKLDAAGWLARTGRGGALTLKGELMGEQFTFVMGPQRGLHE